MRNSILVAAYTLIALLIFAVVAVPAQGNRGDVIRKILDTANAEASDKLDKLQQDGSPLPASANAFYSAALAEYEAATDALDSGDVASAEIRALNAMDLFKSLFDLLAGFEQDDELADDIELINAIDEDISASQRWADDLRRLANANDVFVDFADYDSAINASADALARGDLAEAEAHLDLAQDLLEEVHDDIQDAADSKKSKKVREFALKAAKRLSTMIDEAKENGLLDPELIEELESLLEQLENATDNDEILEITDASSRLQRVIDEYNTERVENFDDEYLNIQEDIAALYAIAEELGISIGSSEIDDLLSSIREKIDNGQEDDAAEELDRLDSLLHNIEDIVDEFSSVIEDIDETMDVALALKLKAEDNSEVLEEIEQAISLLEEADSLVLGASELDITSESIDDIRSQLESANNLVEDAEDILDEIEDHLGGVEEEQQDDNNSNSGSGNGSDEEDGEEESGSGEQEEEQEQDNDEQQHQVRENSVVELRVGEGAVELDIRIEAGDIEPGTYDVTFSCTDPGMSTVFAEALALDEDGEGEFDTEIELEEGTYKGCQVMFETVVINFEPFTVTG